MMVLGTLTKNKVDWYKLELPKYQKAVDLLTKDAKCLGMVEISVEKVKELEQIKPQQNVSQQQPGENKSGTLTKTSGSGLAGLENEPL